MSGVTEVVYVPPQDPNAPVQPANGNPHFSQRLFSEEVGIASANGGGNPLARDVAYEWSNGRKFTVPG